MCSYYLCHFQGHKPDLRTADWGQLAKLGTKAAPPISETLIFGSAVKVRVRLKLGLD